MKKSLIKNNKKINHSFIRRFAWHLVCVLTFSTVGISFAFMSGATVAEAARESFPEEVDQVCQKAMQALHENRMDDVREVMKPLFHENSKAAEYLPQFAKRIHGFKLNSIQPEHYSYQTLQDITVHYARYAMHFPEATIFIQFDLQESSGNYLITNLQVRGAEAS